ncbi:MAG: phosphatidate cytidylyltransferase [Gammaproteobacteria bacterium]
MSPELRNRVGVALVLVPLVVLINFALPTTLFALLIGVFVVLGAWEWPPLVGVDDRAARLRYAGATAVLMMGIWPWMDEPTVLLSLALAALAWWATNLAWVVRYQQGVPEPASAGPGLKVVSGWLTLIPAWAGLVYLHGGLGAGSNGAADATATGPGSVMMLLLLVWVADAGAYFAGRRFGEPRLASRVSPGKSVEGLVGGLAAIALLALAVKFTAGVTGTDPWPGSTIMFLGLCVLTGFVSVLGDLAESMLKRMAGVKDSSKLLASHGGVLDRIDSLTAAAPVFAVGLFALAAHAA